MPGRTRSVEQMGENGDHESSPDLASGALARGHAHLLRAAGRGGRGPVRCQCRRPARPRRGSAGAAGEQVGAGTPSDPSRPRPRFQRGDGLLPGRGALARRGRDRGCAARLPQCGHRRAGAPGQHPRPAGEDHVDGRRRLPGGAGRARLHPCRLPGRPTGERVPGHRCLAPARRGRGACAPRGAPLPGAHRGGCGGPGAQCAAHRHDASAWGDVLRGAGGRDARDRAEGTGDPVDQGPDDARAGRPAAIGGHRAGGAPRPSDAGQRRRHRIGAATPRSPRSPPGPGCTVPPCSTPTTPSPPARQRSSGWTWCAAPPAASSPPSVAAT